MSHEHPLQADWLDKEPDTSDWLTKSPVKGRRSLKVLTAVVLGGLISYLLYVLVASQGYIPHLTAALGRPDVDSSPAQASDNGEQPKVKGHSGPLSYQSKPVEDAPNEASWEETQRERLQQLRAYCSQHRDDVRLSDARDDVADGDDDVTVSSGEKVASPRANYDNFLVGQPMKVIYCPVPKVASTSWKYALRSLESNTSVTQVRKKLTRKHLSVHKAAALTRAGVSQGVRSLSYFDEEDAERIISSYPSFLFVRHPFERLVSGYRNKFVDPENELFPKKFGRKIIKRYRQNPSQRALQTGRNVTFLEFAQYVLEHQASNRHWTPLYQLCSPCHVTYDYIGQLETFPVDEHFIIRKLLGEQKLDIFPHLNTERSISVQPYEYSYPEYLSTISKDVSNALYRLYEADFRIFGYRYE